MPALLESRSLTVDLALKSFLEKGTISQPNIALIFSNLGNLDGSFKLDNSNPPSLNGSHERPLLTSSHSSTNDILSRKKKEGSADLRRSSSTPTSPAVPRTISKVDVSLRTSSIAIPLFDQSEQDIISRARVFGAATAGMYLKFHTTRAISNLGPISSSGLCTNYQLLLQAEQQSSSRHVSPSTANYRSLQHLTP